MDYLVIGCYEYEVIFSIFVSLFKFGYVQFRVLIYIFLIFFVFYKFFIEYEVAGYWVQNIKSLDIELSGFLQSCELDEDFMQKRILNFIKGFLYRENRIILSFGVVQVWVQNLLEVVNLR